MLSVTPPAAIARWSLRTSRWCMRDDSPPDRIAASTSSGAVSGSAARGMW